MGDYDDLADRMGEKVPETADSQADIRRWIDNNIDLDPHDSVEQDGKLKDEVSKRIAGERGGVERETDEGTRRFLWDPDNPQWRDADTGNFAPDPDDAG